MPLARRAWEVLGQLEVDADTINVERHLPSHFKMEPPKLEAGGIFNSGYANVFGATDQQPTDVGQLPFQPRRYTLSPVSPSRNHSSSQVLSSPYTTLGSFQAIDAPRPAPRSRQASTTYVGSTEQDQTQDIILSPQQSSMRPVERKPSSQESVHRRRNDAPVDRGKSKWKFGFNSTKKPSAVASGDSSSLSSSALENQRLDEVSLSSLATASKSSGRSKHHRNINSHVAQNSSFVLFWTQHAIQVWDAEGCPPNMTRAISTDSTCILAAVAKSLLAYIIGTRDQKLTARDPFTAVLMIP